jgi:uncharacterized protein DUF5955
VNQDPQQPAGIVISGGTVNIGALASGPNARASQVVVGSGDRRGELARLTQELLYVIGEHRDNLADYPAAQAAAEEASAEIEQGRPDSSRVRQLLENVATAAGPVAAIATAVSTLLRAITGTG